MAAFQYGKAQVSGTAKLQENVFTNGAKSAVRIEVRGNSYVYSTSPSAATAYKRWDYWNPGTMVDLSFAAADVSKPDSWSTDGRYLYANTYTAPGNQVQRFSISGTTLIRDWVMTLGHTTIRTVNYDTGSGKLYAIRAGGIVYELNADGSTPESVLPIIDLGTGTTTRQCKRVGNTIWIVNDSGLLHKCGLSGGTWSLIDSYDLGLGALYGLGATADGTGLWISSINGQVSYWETGDPPVPEPTSMLALASGFVGLAGFAIRRKRA